MRVSVIGGGTVTEREADLARGVGRELGDRGHTVVCGGLGGVMEAACEGAKAAGARTVGILPGVAPGAANRYVDVPIVTGMGSVRNVLVVLNGEGAIAVDGATGTLSEIGHALDLGRPVAGIETHRLPGVEAVTSATEAVDYVEDAVSR